MRFLVWLFAGLSWALGVAAYACPVALPNMVIDHRTAIAEAEWIALVRAGRESETRARLDVVEYVKGDGPRHWTSGFNRSSTTTSTTAPSPA